jgi:hypothetical protein
VCARHNCCNSVSAVNAGMHTEEPIQQSRLGAKWARQPMRWRSRRQPELLHAPTACNLERVKTIDSHRGHGRIFSLLDVWHRPQRLPFCRPSLDSHAEQLHKHQLRASVQECSASTTAQSSLFGLHFLRFESNPL